MTWHEWNNPQVACSLRSHISGLQTRGYSSHEIEGEFFCCSLHKELDDKTTIPNNIAFYAEGDAEEVHVSNLGLNVHVPRKGLSSAHVFEPGDRVEEVRRIDVEVRRASRK